MISADSATTTLSNNSNQVESTERFNHSGDRKLRQEAGQILKINRQYDISTGAIINNERYHHPRNVINYNAHEEHFAASINKVPVSVLLLDKLRSGEITLETELSWTDDDVRAGAGDLDQPDSPREGTVQDVIEDLLHKSGNTAVRVAVNGILGGPDAVNDTWQNEYNLQHTYLVPLEEDRSLFYFGYANTNEALKMLRELTEGNDEYAELVQDYMATNTWDNMGVRSVLGDSKKIKLINKIGYLDDPAGNNRHDIGLIINTKTGKSYSYAFLETAPTSEEATVQADRALQDLGAATLKQAGGNPIKPSADEPSIRSFDDRQPEQGRILY